MSWVLMYYTWDRENSDVIDMRQRFQRVIYDLRSVRGTAAKPALVQPNRKCQMKLDGVIDLSQNLNVNSIDFIDYIGHKIFITVIFSVPFLIGLAYYYSYLSYFGINHLMQTFPNFIFLIQAILPMTAVFLTIFLFLYMMGITDRILNKSLVKSKSKYFLIMDGFLYIITYYLAIEYIFPRFSPPYAESVINCFFAGILIFSFLWNYWLNEKIKNFTNTTKININQIYVIFFIIILLLLIFTGSFKGKIDARKTVEDANGRFIDFEWKGISPIEIDGKELVLITYHEGNYYVVIHQNPAPEFPKVFIIPDDEINLAIIRKSIN